MFCSIKAVARIFVRGDSPSPSLPTPPLPTPSFPSPSPPLTLLSFSLPLPGGPPHYQLGGLGEH